LARYRVIVDRATCIGCGVAPATCPEVFELGADSGKNRVVNRYSVKTDESTSIGVVPEELYDCVKTASNTCPVNAIRVEKAED